MTCCTHSSLAALTAGLLLAAGVTAIAAEKKTELKVGDKAPSFTAVDDKGSPFSSADVVGKKIVVVYFYPADLTGGCTKQACGFRDDSEKLAAEGVTVIGVSGDSVENHVQFKKAQKLNFTLLADEDGKVAHAFGVPVTIKDAEAKVKDADGNPLVLKRKATAKRWTFIIDKNGTIAYKDTNVKPAEDSKTLLQEVAKLKK